MVHHRAVQRRGGLRLSRRDRPAGMRQRRTRGSLADSPVDRLRQGHLQVRPRSRIHRRAADPPQTRPRSHRAADHQGTAGLTPGRGRRRPSRSADPRRQDERQNLRRNTRHRHQRWPTARGLPLPRHRQRMVDEGVRDAGRDVANGHEPGRRPRTAREQAVGRRRGPRPRSIRRGAVPRLTPGGLRAAGRRHALSD